LRGGNLRNWLKQLSELGCEILHIRKTGEFRVRHPLTSRKLRLSRRRKDCQAVVRVYVRHLLRILDGAEDPYRPQGATP
jgi:hypothetical protein